MAKVVPRGGAYYNHPTDLPVGFHANCAGCIHILEGRCRYVVTPKQRHTWPCFFKENVPQRPVDFYAAMFKTGTGRTEKSIPEEGV